MKMKTSQGATVRMLLIVMLVLLIFILLTYQLGSTEPLHSEKAALPEVEQQLSWDKVLHFIPREFRDSPFPFAKPPSSCLSLFTTESSRQINITQEMKEMRKIISKELKSKKGAHFTPEHEILTLTYQELARQDFVHTVCEIGFNVGQSAIAWLTTKPDLELHSFDFGTLSGNFTKHMGEILKEKYPGRFSLTFGDSKKTVLRWATAYGKKCDILSVDGDHRFLTVLQDLLNMKVLAAKRNIIIMDDIVIPDVKHALNILMNVGYIQYLHHCKVPGMDVDYAIAYYPNV